MTQELNPSLAGVLESIECSVSPRSVCVNWTRLDGEQAANICDLLASTLHGEGSDVLWTVPMTEPNMTGAFHEEWRHQFPAIATVYFRRIPTPQLGGFSELALVVRAFVIIWAQVSPDHGRRTGPEDKRLFSERYYPEQGPGVYEVTLSEKGTFYTTGSYSQSVQWGDPHRKIGKVS